MRVSCLIASLAGIVRAARISFHASFSRFRFVTSRRMGPRSIYQTIFAEYWCGSLLEERISEIFFQRLGDEQPVERIAVMQRKRFEANDVSDADDRDSFPKLAQGPTKIARQPHLLQWESERDRPLLRYERRISLGGNVWKKSEKPQHERWGFRFARPVRTGVPDKPIGLSGWQDSCPRRGRPEACFLLF